MNPQEAIEILAYQELGIDYEKKVIHPSEGGIWNGWVVDRQSGFADFRAGLWMELWETMETISREILDALWENYCLYRKREELVAEKFGDEFKRLRKIYEEISTKAEKIREAWRAVIE